MEYPCRELQVGREGEVVVVGGQAADPLDQLGVAGVPGDVTLVPVQRLIQVGRGELGGQGVE